MAQRFWSWIQRLRHTGLSSLMIIWRNFSRCCFRFGGYVRLALGWRKVSDGPNDPVIDNENNPPQAHSPKEVEEGQLEASDRRQSTSELPVSKQSEDDDGFDSEEYRVDRTDEFYCDYDSTWETEDHQRDTGRRTVRPAASNYKFDRFKSAARDMQNYRHDYPVVNSRYRPSSYNKERPNLEFYLGQRPSLPDGILIHIFHNDWYGDYDRLENVHSYIQWLFPLQEQGMNWEASTLTKEEIKDFLADSTAKANLQRSYKLMLDFYGIELCDEKTGEVRKASNWRERFHNLNSHTHNSLRITRILKCLGTLGYPHYQYPLVRFFLEETLIHGQLPHIKDSVLSYFMFAVLDKKQRRRLIHFAYKNYEPKDEFVWCPKKIQMKWSKLHPSYRRESIENNMQIPNTEYLSVDTDDSSISCLHSMKQSIV